jgi:hypothetical protein
MAGISQGSDYRAIISFPAAAGISVALQIDYMSAVWKTGIQIHSIEKIEEGRMLYEKDW